MAGKNEIEYIKLESLSLGMDQTSYNSLCPFCSDGGVRGSFSLTRIEGGILFNCFRDKCGACGRVPINASSLDYGHKRSLPGAVFEPRYYNYPLTKLHLPARKFLRSKYGLLDTEIDQAGFRWAGEHERIYMPVRNPSGTELGAQLRSYDTSERSKTLNYKWVDEAFIHWPKVNSVVAPGGPIILVEDIVSSIRCARFADSCALLGTSLSPALARVLCAKYAHVLVALDPDAYGKAMKMWKDYALFFKRFDVVKLPKDPKDMEHNQLEIYLDPRRRW